MPSETEFVRHVREMIDPIGGVAVRSMFGGFGIYKGSLMFGLVSEDTLYLKVDDESKPDFESRGLEPFTYERKSRAYAMSYYRVPDDALENPAELQQWAEKAHRAAVRAGQSKRSRRSPRLQ